MYKPTKTPLQYRPLGTPGATLFIDLVGPFTPSNSFVGYLSILDGHSRFPYVAPVKDFKAKTVAEQLFKYFCLFSCPQEIVSDLGQTFLSDIVTSLYHLLHI